MGDSDSHSSEEPVNPEMQAEENFLEKWRLQHELFSPRPLNLEKNTSTSVEDLADAVIHVCV